MTPRGWTASLRWGWTRPASTKATRLAPTQWVTGLVDLEQCRLLEVVADRTRAAVGGWLHARTHDWLAGIGTVALDPWRGYASALVAPLGHARVVVDHFHAIKLANAVVDQVRRRTQQATFGHRGRKRDPLYRIRKLLLTAAEQLTSRGRVRLRAGLAAGDPSGEVVAAWQGKELLRAVYAASDLGHARAALERLLPLVRWRPGPRAVPPGSHRTSLGGREPRVPHHRRLLQRTHPSHEPAHQKGQARRARLPQLRQLPAAAAVALRRQVADSPDRKTARPLSTLGGVEPDKITGIISPGTLVPTTGGGVSRRLGAMLRRDLILLVTGFLLTTVVGGIIGSFLQRRSWDHEFNVQRREREQARAETVFEELSGLLDKRRYRMLRLYWYLKDADQGQGAAKENEQRHKQYVDILYQWNDALNRRLALIESHFSREMREGLDHIYKEYKDVGEFSCFGVCARSVSV
jgi:hypothetical protein